MMLCILLVAGLGVGMLYVSKKVLPKVTNAAGKEIRIRETAYLGPRKALHLVEIGNHKLLIGSTNDSITALADMTDTWLDVSKQEPEDAGETVNVPADADNHILVSLLSLAAPVHGQAKRSPAPPVMPQMTTSQHQACCPGQCPEHRRAGLGDGEGHVAERRGQGVVHAGQAGDHLRGPGDSADACW